MTAAVRTVGSLLCLCAVSSAASVGHGGGGNGVFRLLVLHTNDMHANFAQFSESGVPCADDPPPGPSRLPPSSSGCRGGFPRLKTALRRERESAAADPRVDGTLFLNAGDTFQGTKFYRVFKWPVVAAMLAELDVDVMVSTPPPRRSTYCAPKNYPSAYAL